jgi:segregation and condensation protein A
VRRLQEYERYKQAAMDIDNLERLERDVVPVAVDVAERKVVTILPDITLKELLLAFKDVMQRADMFAHHHVQREPLSVRERMSQILLALGGDRYVDFPSLFDPAEGRMGVTVTFLAILELLKETLVNVVQSEPYGPIHVRAAQGRLADVTPETAV